MKYVIYDLETTGLNPESEGIVQVGYLALNEDLSIHSGDEELINPGIPIPLGASVTHYILDEDVKNAPKFEDSKFYRLLKSENVTLIGYNNVHFDNKFINKFGFDFNITNTIDLWRFIFSRHCNEDVESFNLSYQMLSMGLLPAVRAVMKANYRQFFPHNAISDCFMVYVMLKHLITSGEVTIDEIFTDSKSIIKLKKLTFGKHKGKLIDEVLVNDNKYIWWVLETAIKDKTMKHRAEIILGICEAVPEFYESVSADLGITDRLDFYYKLTNGEM